MLINTIFDRSLEILDNEHIKYDKSKLSEIAKYCSEKYTNQKKGAITVQDYVLEVANEVSKLRLDDISVYASLLHGINFCSKENEKNISNKFGKELASIVDTVDKLSDFNSKSDKNNEGIRNMFMAIAKDIRTVIIRLADILVDMRHISSIEDEKTRYMMAKEVLSIYAPIAHRLGMSQLKSELEDISFKVILPEEYHNIKIQIDNKKKEREEYIENRINDIKITLSEQGINAHIYGRPKHFYSIYKKMKEKNYKIDDLFDLLAIRIIVNSIKDCYNVLGIVHDMYKPMPGRFKDYIAVPKTNGYQSLHTTVFGENSKPFEIQIRTWDMHKVAENGVAAHFSYKEKNSQISESDKKIVWLKKALELQKELGSNNEELFNLNGEIFGEEVYVFTPNGDIKAFPKGATVIDFAYSIHQKVAEKMSGAKINYKIVPINTKLQNSDVIEIITSSKSSGPSVDWLKNVKTTSARNKITSYLKKQGKVENISKGKEIFERYLKKQKTPKEILLKDKYINYMLKKSNFNTLDECYENIGFGSISVLKIMSRLNEAVRQDTKNLECNLIDKNIEKKKKLDNSNLVIVDKIENCKVQFAKCCTPIPGDEIIGYITHSNGVSVHEKNCCNLKNLDGNRIINVSWVEKEGVSFIAKLYVKANNRNGIIADIINCLKENKVSIQEMNNKITLDRECITYIVLNIENSENLQRIIRNLKKIDSVFEVKRVK